ncbi:hypothetical protein AA313_de0208612 [Arthrobotrys entomopaga]|nr:hypothetical protein AA313_de0208612 [Arthrobotrys entomopaga]
MDSRHRSPRNGPPPRIIRYSDDSRESYYSERESIHTISTSPTASYEDMEDRRVYRAEPKYVSEAKPSTPPLFAHLFPSTRRLTIKHDDSADGNMNLRIDTDMSHSSEPARLITLFHMKMNNLKNRDMVLRRYGRECGREVVNFRRKYAKPTSSRPKLERSGSKLMNSLMGKSEPKDRTLARQDSGYESGEDEDEEFSDVEQKAPTAVDQTSHGIPTNTTMLEFSNYAHVDLKRRGSKGSKRYEFEYWGKHYTWKRKITVYGQEESCSYYLINTATNNIIAHIRPDNLSPNEVAEEQAKGGFVPPSTMWLCDDTEDSVIGSMCDVADVVVATGIYALVDDSIKRKFSRRKRVVQLVLPTMRGNTVKMNMEYVGPKRLIDQVFNRPNGSPRKNTNPSTISQKPPSFVRTASSSTTTGAPAAERAISRPAALRAASTRV